MTSEQPFTPRVQHVLEIATQEAQQRGHTYIGTEHLLLALLNEPEGIAWHVLAELGVTDVARQKLTTLMESAQYTTESQRRMIRLEQH